jgi:hypothetical protein
MQHSRQPTSRAELEAYGRMIKILYFTLFATIPMYWFIQEAVVAGWEPAETGAVKTALLVAGAGTAAVVLFLRYSLIPPLLAGATLEWAQRLARLRAYYIFCFAVSETVALYGFVLRLVGGSRQDAVPFFAAAVALFLLCYPRTPQRLSGPMG